jgi:hypothetical protein
MLKIRKYGRKTDLKNTKKPNAIEYQRDEREKTAFIIPR